MDAEGGADMMIEIISTTQKLAEWPTLRLLRRLRAVDQSAVDSFSRAFHLDVDLCRRRQVTLQNLYLSA